MDFNDFLHERQPYSSTFCVLIKFIEDAKYLFLMLRRYSHSIVFDKENRFAVFLTLLTDLNPRMGLFSHEFSSIVDQILDDFQQAVAISQYLR